MCPREGLRDEPLEPIRERHVSPGGAPGRATGALPGEKRVPGRGSGVKEPVVAFSFSFLFSLFSFSFLFPAIFFIFFILLSFSFFFPFLLFSFYFLFPSLFFFFSLFFSFLFLFFFLLFSFGLFSLNYNGMISL